MRRPALIASALAATAALALAGTAAASKPVNIYGVGNQNNIWEIDPLAK